MLPVDTEDQIIHGRPYKEGYLKKQINSIFDIWNTRYFYLDNTNFAYFDDEHTDKPSQIINLENCIVDGVWRNGELYTFTIRSLTDDETFLYVGAFSGAEADEWIRNLRAAVKLLEVDKIAEEMRDHGLNMPEIRNFIDKDDRFAEFEDRKSAETESDRDLDKGANEEMDWLTYLKMPNKEKIVDMPPQLDTAYHEFKRLLKNTSMYYTVLKSENYVNVCVHEYDPQYWIYKTSFFINGDFYNLVKVLNSDSNEKFWNPYLAEIKQTRKLAENIQVFNSEYELELKNFIFTFQSFYINQAWIDRSKFNLIRSNLGASGRNYANNILSFDLPLELFGLRVSQVKCSYPKCKMTIIIKLKKRNFFLDNLFRRFIKKYMIAFTILRDELEELAEKVEVNKPPATEKEKDQTKLASARSEKPASKAPQQSVPEGRKLSFQQMVQQTVQQTNYGPSILELKTPEQKKALEELKKKLSAQGINMSDELTRRFLISKECVVADAETNIKKYQEWLQEMKFEEYDWQDPHMFSAFHQARFIKHVGFDREGRPIAFFRLKSFFPDKLPEEGFKKFMFSFIRWLCQQVKPGAEQYSLIADATDISRSNISLSLFTVCLKNLIAFFPQYVHKMYIVNGGFVVTMLYNTMKPLLKERHRKRLVFCNTSGNEAYKFLKMEMDDDIIPVHLGGKYMDY